MNDNLNADLQSIVRVGKVMDRDVGRKCARIKFEDTGIISGWLQVLQHSVNDKWVPNINEIVVCLYLPTFNGDGYILGSTQ